jgi:hypothetical protein
MRPVRIIAALLSAATPGTLTLLAAPAWAEPVAIHVSPSAVVAGSTVTVSGSAGPACTAGVTLISKAFVHTNDFAGLPALFAAVEPGGAFTATTRIPRSRAAGTYTITGRCGGGNLGVSATLVVRAAPTAAGPAAPPTTGPAATQPPATQPPATAGPAAQPGTPAAAHTATRWIIPGLAALGSGGLAALGVWLLYRRRHPGGPVGQGQGRSRAAH